MLQSDGETVTSWRRLAFGLISVVLVIVALPADAREAGEGNWRRYDKVEQGISPGSAINDVEWLGDEFVAVGEVYPATGDGPHAALWRSQNGRRWVASPLPDDATSLSGVARWDARIWVAGSSRGQRPTATLWSSKDGIEWTAELMLGSPSTFVYDLVIANNTLIAVGGQTTGPISSVGRIWTLAAGAEAFEQTELPGVVEAVALDDGEVVALVALPEGGKGRRALTYVSDDARTWREDTNLGWSVDPGSGTLGRWNGSLWAATYPRSGANASSYLWTRTQGTWSRARDLPAGFVVDQIVDSGEYLIVTGFDDGRPGALVSSDGGAWIPMRIARPLGGRLSATAGNTATAVAFGSAPELRDYYVWHHAAR